MSEHKKLIGQILRTQKEALAEKEELVKHLPEGYLVFQESGINQRLYWAEPVKSKDGSKEKYHRLGNKDYDFAKEIQDKFIYQNQIPALRTNIKYLEKLLDHYVSCDDNTILEQLNEPYRSLKGISPPINYHVPSQSENPFYQNRLVFRNFAGEFFRSKSEVVISEILHSMEIPYHYEKRLTINGETKYPDFTLLRGGLGRDKYIEYFGMMDREDYIERNLEKINWYLNHKIIPGERILFLYENSQSGLDAVLVRKQIEAFMKM